MGTFDSVYKNKIRQLEEENQQLRNIIDEAFAGISRRTLPKLEDLPTPIDGRGANGGRGVGSKIGIKIPQGINPFAKMPDILPKLEKPDFIMNNPPEPAPIDGRDVYRRANAGRGDGSYMASPSKRNAGLRINDKLPEPAPYPSDDMESRRAAEAERARGERLRNELRGGGPQYRRTPPKSDLSFW